MRFLFSFPGLWSGGLSLCSCCCYCCKITCKSVNNSACTEMSDCAGDAKPRWLFGKGFCVGSSLGKGLCWEAWGGWAGGNSAKPLQPMSRVGFAAGRSGRESVTPAFRWSRMEMYRSVCKSVVISASLSPGLAYLFQVGLLRGFVSG